MLTRFSSSEACEGRGGRMEEGGKERERKAKAETGGMGGMGGMEGGRGKGEGGRGGEGRGRGEVGRGKGRRGEGEEGRGRGEGGEMKEGKEKGRERRDRGEGRGATICITFICQRYFTGSEDLMEHSSKRCSCSHVGSPV